jgi:hypothetical protein
LGNSEDIARAAFDGLIKAKQNPKQPAAVSTRGDSRPAKANPKNADKSEVRDTVQNEK